ncbi:hypothetical protein B1759_16545 [Rubrivirga sp. SAORIC476]|uniref:hypothetical protein n=1 Tax=Rubrivirga sp. SAORIC476 TaxID=1961794 RepID=UPI000BA8F1A7|nr:hypothetical protein [Rubrivirga sp. SAORIC476]PAP74788.1 hypothetical protein B1759_16545 [Rubrivirga sp. SAORIC476]
MAPAVERSTSTDPAPSASPSPSVYRVVGDFDGDGRDDYAVGEACGVHGACEFAVFRAAPDGRRLAVGSVLATYDEIRLCPGEPPRLVTTVRQGTAYTRAEYVVGLDSAWAVRADTSSLEGGGPPDSWWTRECSGGLDFYEATEADVDARGDSAWQPVAFPS